MKPWQKKTFQHLRSWMQQGSLNEEQRKVLWKTLREAYRRDEAFYQEVCLPYIQGFAFYAKRPAATVTTLNALEEAVSMMPEAKFLFDGREGKITQEDFMTLTTSPLFQSVSHLDLGVARLGDRGAAVLSQSPYAGGLEALNLYLTGVGRRGMEQLCESDALENLTSLNLCYNKIGSGGVDALVDSPLLAKLEVLNLSMTDLTNRDLEALVRSPCFAGLRELDLNFNQSSLGNHGVIALAESEHVNALDVLNLETNDVRDAGVQALAQSTTLTALNVLKLYNNQALGNEGAIALSNAASLVSLHTLTLGNCKAKVEALVRIVESKTLTQWRRLEFQLSGITDRGFHRVVNSPNVRKLHHLDLFFNQLTESCLESLAQTSQLENLRYLNLKGNDISSEAVKRMKLNEACEYECSS